MNTIRTSRNGNSYNRGISSQGTPSVDFSERSNAAGYVLLVTLLVIAAGIAYAIIALS